MLFHIPKGHDMNFLSDPVTDGVCERRFVEGAVPGLLSSPSPGRPAARWCSWLRAVGCPSHTAVLSRPRRYAGSYGSTVVALGAYGHGGRPRSAELAASLAALAADMAGGAQAVAVARLNAEIAAAAVPVWRAVLGALQADGLAVCRGRNGELALGLSSAP